MTTHFSGILETRHVRLITRRASRCGFRGQDLDEVVQETVIRLCRTEVRDAAMIVAATHESIADVCRRESRHQGRVQRLQQLTTTEQVASNDTATALALDVQTCVQGLCKTDQLLCEYLSRGYTIRETAEQLRLSPAAVQARKRRIQQHFVRYELSGGSP